MAKKMPNAAMPAARSKWPHVSKITRQKKTVWMVDGRSRSLAGGGKRRSFATKDEAEGHADKIRLLLQNEGLDGVSIPAKLRIEAIACQQRLGAVGASLTDAVDYFLAHARPSGGTRTAERLVAEFLTAKTDAKCRAEYLRVQKYVLGNFVKAFGVRNANEISAEELEAWIASHPWSDRTRRNVFRDLRNLYGFAVKKHHCATNPMLRLEAPRLDESAAPGILTPAQAEALLAATVKRGGAITAFVAIGLFAGLRTAELRKLLWDHINLDDGTILVAPYVSKTREHRYVKISANLSTWLLKFKPDKPGPVCPPAWRWHLEESRKLAKITTWPRNAMRHSFGSYHYAQHADAPLTASQLGHRNDTRTLFAHYRAVAKPKDAAAFWDVKPADFEKKLRRGRNAVPQ